MAKLRAEQLAALQMFDDDSDEEPGKAEDTAMEQAEATDPAKPPLPAEETGTPSGRQSLTDYP